MQIVKVKSTNYVVVVDYEQGQTLSDCYLLGWSNEQDWYDCNTLGSEIMTPTGAIKKNLRGLIEVGPQVSVYVGETDYDCKDQAEGANNDGYNCTVCRLKKYGNDWNLIPV